MVDVVIKEENIEITLTKNDSYEVIIKDNEDIEVIEKDSNSITIQESPKIDYNVSIIDNLGTRDHTVLENRDASDQHPISAITGLETNLEDKVPYTGAISDVDLGTKKITSTEFEFTNGESMTWNPDDKTVNILTGEGSTLQVGQESYLPYSLAKNNTGETILNGSVVYLCEGGGVICLDKANSRDYTVVEKTVGIVTADIADGESGIVTTYGLVRGIDTSSYAVNTTLYVSPEIDGELTDVRPVNGDWVIPIGEVITSHASTGILFVKYLQVFDPNDLKSATGFPEQNAAVKDNDAAFVNATRTFSLTPTGDYFYVWQLGVKYNFTDVISVQIPDEEGLYYIYLDEGVMEYAKNPTAGETITLIREKVLCANISWDATNKVASIIGDERHGHIMSSDTHAWGHYSFGAQWISGLALNNLDVDGSGDDDISAQFGVEAGVTLDEDLINISMGQDSTVGFPIFYLDGANGYLRRMEKPGFSVTTFDGTTATRLAYNEYTGSTWQISEVANNDFALCHIFATNSKQDPVIAFMGQGNYATLGQARTGANTEISTIVTNYPAPELIPIATFIYQTSSGYDNEVSARVRSTDEGDDYVDWRQSELQPGAAPTDHGNLSGLGNDDHTQYSLANGTRAFTGVVGGITPTADTHLATKKYVDDNAGGSGASVICDGGIISNAEVESIVPKMTDNTTPIGYVASGTAASTNKYEDYDGNYGTKSDYTGSFPYTSQIEIPVAKVVKSYKLVCWSIYSTRMIKDWTFEGSNTGAWAGEEVTIDTVSGETGWGDTEQRLFDCSSNTTAYLHHRIKATANNGDTVKSIAQLELYEQNPNLIINVSKLYSTLSHDRTQTLEIDTDILNIKSDWADGGTRTIELQPLMTSNTTGQRTPAGIITSSIAPEDVGLYVALNGVNTSGSYSSDVTFTSLGAEYNYNFQVTVMLKGIRFYNNASSSNNRTNQFRVYKNGDTGQVLATANGVNSNGGMTEVLFGQTENVSQIGVILDSSYDDKNGIGEIELIFDDLADASMFVWADYNSGTQRYILDDATGSNLNDSGEARLVGCFGTDSSGNIETFDRDGADNIIKFITDEAYIGGITTTPTAFDLPIPNGVRLRPLMAYRWQQSNDNYEQNMYATSDIMTKEIKVLSQQTDSARATTFNTNNDVFTDNASITSRVTHDNETRALYCYGYILDRSIGDEDES